MDATMMRVPLTTRMIVRRGARLFPESRVLQFDGTTLSETPYSDIAERADRLASFLDALGVRPGDRVGTLSWNNRAHFEAYLAVPAMGAVLHTLNVRLFPEQLSYIINHAEDRVLFVEASLLPAIAPVLGELSSVRHLILLGTPGVDIPAFAGEVHDYDSAVAGMPPFTRWPDIDENSAAVMCYTSGTTGNPKGVVYSHRSIYLHSLGSMGIDSFAISNRDRLLMLPPMFHANAWGMPFSGWFAGSDFVLPGHHLHPDNIATMVEAARPTFTAAVPTILNDLLRMHERKPIDMSSFRALISGGSAVSPVLIERVRAAWGIDLVQGWGMTETSPICVLSFPPRDVPADEGTQWRARSGRPVAGMEVRIVDEADRELPNDGIAVGNLQLRGPWVAAGYHGEPPEAAPLSADGWLRTGDAGTIDPRGYVQITDRTKDLIKSGGEWISSVDLEHCISAFPGVAEVAVVAVPDPRWEERPLAIIVEKEEGSVDFRDVRQYLAGKIAKFMIPEYWARLSGLPKTGVGKIDKKRLRGEAHSGELAYVVEHAFTDGDSV